MHLLSKHRGLTAALVLLTCRGLAEESKPEPKPEAKPTAAATPSRPRGERPGFWQGDENLSEEARQAIREAQRTFREDTRALTEELRAARKDLEDLVFAEKPDAAATKSKAAEIGRIEGEIAGFRAKMIASIRPKLTADQLARLKNNRGDWTQLLRERRPEGAARPKPAAKEDKPSQ